MYRRVIAKGFLRPCVDGQIRNGIGIHKCVANDGCMCLRDVNDLLNVGRKKAKEHLEICEESLETLCEFD